MAQSGFIVGVFEIAELTEVMRQQGDNNFINLLNHVRKAELDDYDDFILKSRFVSPTESYSKDALHIFAEKAPANIQCQFVKFNKQ